MEEEQKLVQRSSVLSRLQMSPMSLWLLDMARKLPEVKLDGFAIDTSSAPSPQWLPPNVRLRQVDNFTDDLLKGEQEAYDIVRIANLAGFIVDNNPGPVIQNAMAMLKPGGYIEWDELDSAHHGVVRSTSTAPSPRIHELLRCVHDHEHALGPRGWINSLPDILARHGLQVPLGQHRYRLPLAYAKVDNDTWFEEFEALSYRLESQEHGNELRRLMIAAKEACAKDEQAVTADLVIAVGRKITTFIILSSRAQHIPLESHSVSADPPLGEGLGSLIQPSAYPIDALQSMGPLGGSFQWSPRVLLTANDAPAQHRAHIRDKTKLDSSSKVKMFYDSTITCGSRATLVNLWRSIAI
ncbi:MAG: hypothetical protein L6R40_002030 [Gallowayella cf. fulva]|nr:MAG: hypothetical protein L6R40_002030 [Xanthomendoza cf. fulva]